MKKYFLDTNILLDLLADRKPFSKYAQWIFQEEEQRKVRLYTSTHAIATLFYLLKKGTDEKKLKAVLLELCSRLTLVAIDDACIYTALRSEMKDAEDALQLAAAATIRNLEAIVTRNTRDFKGSPIRICSPDELFAP